MTFAEIRRSWALVGARPYRQTDGVGGYWCMDALARPATRSLIGPGPCNLRSRQCRLLGRQAMMQGTNYKRGMYDGRPDLRVAMVSARRGDTLCQGGTTNGPHCERAN